MKLRQFRERMQYCGDLESRLRHHPQQVKEEILDKMGVPLGLHTLGFPLAISLLCAVLSFALPQFWIWSAIYAGFNLPQHAVLVGVFATGLGFAIFNCLTAFFTGKGYMLAVRAHLTLSALTLAVSLLFLLTALFSLISGEAIRGVSLSGALISVALALGGAAIATSFSFYRMLLYALHNRAWRKLL